MTKEFLFGRMYEGLTLDEKECIFKNKTSYEINKNTFINNIYDNEKTMRHSYNAIKKNIIPFEKIKEKDLMYFNSEDLTNLMHSIPTSSVNTKERIYYLINNYLDWCINKNMITINFLNGLDKKELLKVSEKSSSYSYMSKKMLLKYCEEILLQGDLSANEILPLILARYGIVGEKLSRMINLKWDDIDRKNMIVYIFEDENIINIDIDNDFLDWIDKAYETTEHGKYIYIDNGMVLKTRNDYVSPKVDVGYIYNKTTSVFNLDIMPRTSFKTLEFSYKIDILLKIREDRPLTSFDFRELTMKFKPNASPSATNIFIKAYESTTRDEVELYKKSSIVSDLDSKKTVREIKKRIGYDV